VALHLAAFEQEERGDVPSRTSRMILLVFLESTSRSHGAVGSPALEKQCSWRPSPRRKWLSLSAKMAAVVELSADDDVLGSGAGGRVEQ